MRTRQISVVRNIIIRGAVGTLLPALFLAACSERPQLYRDWRVYSGDAAGTKYSALEQINTDNVGQLDLAWIYRTDDVPVGNGSTIECNPIVVDGVMYLTSASLKVIALDADTGALLKRFPFNAPGEPSATLLRFTRTAVTNKRIVIGNGLKDNFGNPLARRVVVYELGN